MKPLAFALSGLLSLPFIAATQCYQNPQYPKVIVHDDNN